MPIIVRHYSGERATIDGSLTLTGSDVWIWGLEVANNAAVDYGVVNNAPRSRLINLVVHDAKYSGIGLWKEAPDAEVYGCVVYNNGTRNNQDHGIYIQNTLGQKRLLDNIVFNNWAVGLHAYAGPAENGYLTRILMDGNVLFNSGVIGGAPGGDIVVGGSVPAGPSIAVTHNYVYRTDRQLAVDLGYFAGARNVDVTFTNNYLAGGSVHVANWATAVVSGNAVYNFGGDLTALDSSVSGYTWDATNIYFGNPSDSAWLYNSTRTTFTGWKSLTGFGNPGAYAGGAPTGQLIVVRTNLYEPDRGNIIVYNWAQQGTVDVDLSGVLDTGDHYVVQNAQDFYGPAVVSGTYAATPISLPTAGIPAPVPIGRGVAGPVTGPTFNVFVVMKAP
jgi:hypothetical protein